MSLFVEVERGRLDVFRPPSTIKGVCVGENYNIFYNDKKACLFDMNSLEVLDELDSSRISPGSAEFSFNESFVLLTGLSSSLLWDITNKTEKNIPLTKIGCSKFNNDSTEIYFGRTRGSADSLYDIEYEKEKATFNDQTRRTSGISFHPVDQFLVCTVGWDRNINLIDTRNGKVVFNIPEADSNNIKSVCFNEDYEIYAGSNSQTIKKWNLKTGGCKESIKTKGIAVKLLCTETGHLFANMKNNFLVIEQESKEVIYTSRKPGWTSNSSGHAICYSDNNWTLYKNVARFSRAKSARK